MKNIKEKEHILRRGKERPSASKAEKSLCVKTEGARGERKFIHRGEEKIPIPPGVSTRVLKSLSPMGGEVRIVGRRKKQSILKKEGGSILSEGKGVISGRRKKSSSEKHHEKTCRSLPR